ncbi:MAG: metallophosphoesterase [Patescibacteria group bacterium]|nr:metallophosphoesterase [Patescibacteria group bacterium]
MNQITKFFLLVLIVVFSGCDKQVMTFENIQIVQESEKTEITPSNSIKIGIITDIHKCEKRSPGKITSERLTSFVSDVDNRDIDFNVDLGDNIRYRMDNCNNNAHEELQWVVDNLKTSAPLYHVLSDHDIDDVASFEFWKKTTNTEKTFYSFDEKNYHIIVLDTVSGDGQLDEVCENFPTCENAKKAYEEKRDLLKNSPKLEKYLADNNTTKEALEKERVNLEKKYYEIRHIGKELALNDRRDKGSVLQPQMDWLKNDLTQTGKEKVIIFSDHPLLAYQGKRKLYKIVGLEKLTKVLNSSGKEIVAVCGETHEWHKEKIGNIQFYLIGIFSGSNIGSWAILDWDEKGPRLERVKK